MVLVICLNDLFGRMTSCWGASGLQLGSGSWFWLIISVRVNLTSQGRGFFLEAGLAYFQRTGGGGVDMPLPFVGGQVF